MKLIELSSINQYYGQMQVLSNISLSLEEGEVLGLFGHNGAGKTTCMKLVLGLLKPTEGSVSVFGGLPTEAQRRRALGYLPENVTFYPQLTGLETLRHFARIKGASLSQVEELLDKVGLAHASQRRVKTYSKGMRQRLGLAQALLGQPRLLLLDEPTVGLDPIATQELYQLIDSLRCQGTGIILCSHVLPGVEAYIDRAAILSHGQLQAVGTLAQLAEQVGLPAWIRVKITEPQKWHDHLSGLGHQVRLLPGRELEVAAPNGDKISLLRTLLHEGVSDVEIHRPTLDDLYRHYVICAANTGGSL
ncbi:ABC transporter ATP-binding protein [Bowmanella dokdonensis]|uniref:ABC transporter ATP-binding protein n=1 Tax=Bowmanella dokdonensis TaxID=751969 RepID=A0A939IN04_9ALTE|nr:ABC transporter ATP-binding protein [Bowmanella dokdonensis]MBN7824340.1 ABC transporter ATP-binding protein [Bowmanella dokdonensis]